MASRGGLGMADKVYKMDYVHGNTVRKINTQSQIPQRKHVEIPKKRINHTVRRNQQKALFMDLPYVVLLTIATICTLCICVNYIHVQSVITARIHNIETLEKEVEALKSENNASETRINTYVDLDYVYKVATEELGMVYANKNQVRLYDKTESEYVRQYEDIPEH